MMTMTDPVYYYKFLDSLQLRGAKNKTTYPTSSFLTDIMASSQVFLPCHLDLQTEQNFRPH